MLVLVACQPTGTKTAASVELTAPSSFVIPDSSLRQISAPDTLFTNGIRPAQWKLAGFSDPTAFKRFLALFKDWVVHGQADSITAHINFPLAHYKSAAVFKQAYGQVFDSAMKATVLQQPLNCIFRNYQGAMLGNGEIWWAELNGQYKIIAINK
ncbi:hypothetical protein DCM91_05020 [Chitinophaga costaii]|nr:hypothetical protein DCM91_05020 [Chitinophaga costaii]